MPLTALRSEFPVKRVRSGFPSSERFAHYAFPIHPPRTTILVTFVTGFLSPLNEVQEVSVSFQSVLL